MHRKPLSLTLTLTVAVLTLAPGTIPANTITVDTTVDSLGVNGSCSLREAITSANTDTAVDSCTPGQGVDVIELPAGTYTLAISGAHDDFNVSGDLDVESKLTIRGLAGQDRVIIDGNGIDRVFQVSSTALLILEDLTVTGGDAGGDYGGGILNQGKLTMVRSQVSFSSAARGAGIENVEAATLVLEDSSVVSNSSTGNGGGIFNGSSYSNAVTLIRSSLSGNTCQGSGGGLASRAMEIVDCTIAGNTAGDNGGGIWWPSDSYHLSTVVNTTFSGNRSGTDGGAMYYDGGGGLLKLRSVTITGNTADYDADDDGDGGGIYAAGGGTVDLANTILAGNDDASAGMFASYIPECIGALTSSGYNLFGALSLGFCAIGGDTTGNLVGTVGAEIDAGLGPLTANGGPTESHLPTAESPVLDAGDPAGCVDPDNQTLLFDQRGFDRTLDGPDPDTDPRCDIGATELDATAFIFRDGFEDGTTTGWSDASP